MPLAATHVHGPSTSTVPSTVGWAPGTAPIEYGLPASPWRPSTTTVAFHRCSPPRRRHWRCVALRASTHGCSEPNGASAEPSAATPGGGGDAATRKTASGRAGIEHAPPIHSPSHLRQVHPSCAAVGAACPAAQRDDTSAAPHSAQTPSLRRTAGHAHGGVDGQPTSSLLSPQLFSPLHTAAAWVHHP